MFLRQSTSQVIRFGPFLDSTDGVTPETGLTIAQADMQLSKDGGAFAQKNASGNATHDTDGWYSTTLNTTDTATTGELKIQVNVSGALPVWEKWFVLTQSAYDALQTGTFNNLGGTAQSADHTAAIADIPTVSEFNARTLVAANYFDPAADTVANVTLVATTTTNIDMRGTDSANTVVPPSVAQFNARTILSANYGTAASQTTINNNVLLIPTTPMRGTDGANTTTPPTTAQIWAEATRELTSGVNIVLAKGVGVTGFNDITAASVLAAGDVDGFTLEESQKLILSASVGILAGAATNNITIEAADGSKTRITATVDVDGNRSAVVKDVTG